MELYKDFVTLETEVNSLYRVSIIFFDYFLHFSFGLRFKISQSNIPHSVWKLPKMSHLNFSILAFSTIFCSIKSDMSGNTAWPQASDFQKLAKMDQFWHF